MKRLARYGLVDIEIERLLPWFYAAPAFYLRMATVSPHHITDFFAYWVLFWSLVNVALPPREIFANSSAVTQRRYNTLLMLVAYYGSLNLRKVTTGLYSAVQTGQVVQPEQDQTKPIQPGTPTLPKEKP